MSKQANPVMIGGFVLGALALLVTAILVLSSGVLLQTKEKVVSHFPGTVSGLSVGARVEFQGVQVGKVTGIALEYHTEDGHFVVPVTYEIWPESTKIVGGEVHDIDEGYRLLVERMGLRAKLESVSLLTGQYMIALSLQPDTPIHRVGLDKDIVEIPTIEADRDLFANTLREIDINGLIKSVTGALEAIEKLASGEQTQTIMANTDELLIEARRLITGVDARVISLTERLDGTLDDYAQLARTTATRVEGLADSLESASADLQRLAGTLGRQTGRMSQSASDALDEAGKAMSSFDELLGRDSQARYDLELMLKEAAGAARSLRILADYLQQNPDALIRGK